VLSTPVPCLGPFACALSLFLQPPTFLAPTPYLTASSVFVHDIPLCSLFCRTFPLCPSFFVPLFRPPALRLSCTIPPRCVTGAPSCCFHQGSSLPMPGSPLCSGVFSQPWSVPEHVTFQFVYRRCPSSSGLFFVTFVCAPRCRASLRIFSVC